MDMKYNSKDYYQSNAGIEVIDVIDAFTDDLTGTIAFDSGNMIKYACRWNKKHDGVDKIEDLKKIIWYASDIIARLKKEN